MPALWHKPARFDRLLSCRNAIINHPAATSINVRFAATQWRPNRKTKPIIRLNAQMTFQQIRQRRIPRALPSPKKASSAPAAMPSAHGSPETVIVPEMRKTDPMMPTRSDARHYNWNGNRGPGRAAPLSSRRRLARCFCASPICPNFAPTGSGMKPSFGASSQSCLPSTHWTAQTQDRGALRSCRKACRRRDY